MKPNRSVNSSVHTSHSIRSLDKEARGKRPLGGYAIPVLLSGGGLSMVYGVNRGS